MNILRCQYSSPGHGTNGGKHSVFPAPMGASWPSSHHHHPDACQHLLPVALPSPPASNNAQRRLQPSRSTCRAPLVIDANGGSPPRPEEPLLIHRSSSSSADHGAAVVKAQGRRVLRSGAVVAGSMEAICGPLPHLLDGGGGSGSEEEQQCFKLPADAATTAHYHISHRRLTEEELERKATGGSTAAEAVDLEPRSGTLGFVRALMEDDKFSQLMTQQEYHSNHGPGISHIGRQLLFSPDDHQEPPSGDDVVTLAVSVSSAVKLESKQMDQIAKKMRRLTGFKNLKVENSVDPSLIAGFIIRYGVGDAHVIDLSVKGRLAELEARLESSDQSAGAEGWNNYFPGMR